MSIKDNLKSLANAVCIGSIDEAASIAAELISPYAEVSRFGGTGVIAKIDKGAPRTLFLDAHIDEVGFVVTNVYKSGFLKVAAVGGIDPRILPATRVTVHGRHKVAAVFTSTPPHLASDESTVVSLEDLFLDTGLGEHAETLVSVGDFATFDAEFSPLLKSRVTGKALDDRTAVACLIEVASRIYDKPLPVNVIFSFSEQEELGTRGAVAAAFDNNCDEAIALDVSFATQPQVSSSESGKLGGGVMIGISPILNKTMTDRLGQLAKQNDIPHRFEVMGGRTGTDADVISVSKSGVPTALLSIPLRNMHTPVEVADLTDLEGLCDLLCDYILGGGSNV